MLKLVVFYHPYRERERERERIPGTCHQFVLKHMEY